MTKRIKDQNGNFKRVAVRIMEITLSQAYQLFVQQHPEFKICRHQVKPIKPKKFISKAMLYALFVVVPTIPTMSINTNLLTNC